MPSVGAGTRPAVMSSIAPQRAHRGMRCRASASPFHLLANGSNGNGRIFDGAARVEATEVTIAPPVVAPPAERTIPSPLVLDAWYKTQCVCFDVDCECMR